MSEKLQHTAASMRVKMDAHYGEEVPHKHNKNHLQDPPHRVTPLIQPRDETLIVEERTKRWSNKMIHDFRERKTRKRLDKGRIH